MRISAALKIDLNGKAERILSWRRKVDSKNLRNVQIAIVVEKVISDLLCSWCLEESCEHELQREKLSNSKKS